MPAPARAACTQERDGRREEECVRHHLVVTAYAVKKFDFAFRFFIFRLQLRLVEIKNKGFG